MGAHVIQTYADVVSLKWKSFSWWIVAWYVSENLVCSPVPLHRVKLLILQSVGTVEHGVLTSKDRVRNLNLQAAQPTNWRH